MATIDPEDVETAAEAIYYALDGIDDWADYAAERGPMSPYHLAGQRAVEVLADRLLPRDATHDTRAFHRTAGSGVEYACSTKDCIVTVTRTEHAATWSVPPLPAGVEGVHVGGRR